MPAPREWYLEYHIARDRPGLLGDVASLLGMLMINIVTINGVDTRRRGLLLTSDDDEKIDLLARLLHVMPNITVTALRPPTLLDRLAVRHGQYIDQDASDRRTLRFLRNDLGILVNFLGELLKEEGHQLIGIRGMPRVGKSEATIAACVYANKRWTIISSTLLRQTVKTELTELEYNDDSVLMIDALVSFYRGSEAHQALVREVLRMNRPKIVEHPDVMVHESEVTWRDFDYVIELRNSPEELIVYDFNALRQRYGSEL